MSLRYTDLDLNACAQAKAVAVGVSGGPDSLALAHLLAGWGAANNIPLHVLIVDHGLRVESAREAAQVRDMLDAWPGVRVAILNWADDKPQSGLAEAARTARYDLMEEYCRAHGIDHLFIAHHQDDQAETFLFRLAKGSGLDGLAAMQPVQNRGALTILRPLLAYDKDTLIAYCHAHDLAFVCDPTNENNAYARPRLRAAQDVLAQEGLTSARLGTTARRLARARRALEAISETHYAALVQIEEQGARIDVAGLRALPEEIALRIVLKAMAQMRGQDHAYPPRLEKVEEMAEAIYAGTLDKTASLGGCLFVPDRKNAILWVRKEGK